MRRAFAYRRVRGSLGSARPWIAAVYLLPLAAVAFTFSNPVVLVATAIAAVAVGLLAGARDSLMLPLRFSAVLFLTVLLVNALVAQRGATVLFRFGELPLLGATNVTFEALAEGLVLGTRIVVSLVVFAIWSACVDPDRILRGIRPLARHSALTATLISRLVPLAAADGARLAEAAKLRGPAAAPVGRTAIVKRLLAGSLERSVDVAATLELRGYGLPTARHRVRNRRVPGEAGLLLAGIALICIATSAALLGVGSFEAYPRVVVDLGPLTFALALGIVAVAVAPQAFDRLRARRRAGGGVDG